MKHFITVLVLIIVISACSSIRSDKVVAGMHYVNMGSSFAAGSGVLPDAEQSIKRCRQSSINYARLLADSLKLKLNDKSCAGAKSIHLLKPWKELPAQIDAVSSETRLVTITVGGNDLNYVRNLFAASCNVETGFIFNGKTMPCSKWQDAPEEIYLQLKTNLLELTKQISIRSPKAKIIFIQYVSLLPKQLCEATPLSIYEEDQIRLINERLIKITKEVTELSGSTLLSSDILSLNHTPCDAQPWSIGATTTKNNKEGMPWHPNRLANKVIAQQLELILKQY